MLLCVWKNIKLEVNYCSCCASFLIDVVVLQVDTAANVQPADVDDIWNLRGVLNNSWHKIRIEAPSRSKLWGAEGHPVLDNFVFGSNMIADFKFCQVLSKQILSQRQSSLRYTPVHGTLVLCEMDYTVFGCKGSIDWFLLVSWLSRLGCQISSTSVQLWLSL